MVRPCTGSRLALRIQVNIETSMPICGEKPLRGPMMFSLSSAAPTTAPAIESDEKPAAPSPQPRTADPFKKLRRLPGFIYLNGPTKCTNSVPSQHLTRIRLQCAIYFCLHRRSLRENITPGQPRFRAQSPAQENSVKN